MLWLFAFFGETMKIRVAVYCRVSTKSETQQHSLGAQRECYEKLVQSTEKYTLAGIYIDVWRDNKVTIFVPNRMYGKME